MELSDNPSGKSVDDAPSRKLVEVAFVSYGLGLFHSRPSRQK